MTRSTACLLAGALALGGAASPTAAQDDAACAACHPPGRLGNAGLEEDGDLLGASVHGQAGLACTDCHADLAGAELPHSGPLAAVDCGACHGEAQEDFAGSVHGYARERANPRAPGCATCHGAHDVLPAGDPASRTHPARRSATCAACHGTAGLTTAERVRLPDTVSSYAASVHGPPAGGGALAAAGCADCHTAHRIRAAEDPESSINAQRIAATCGGCHGEVLAAYTASIHGRAHQAGVGDSPTCTDCHGEHLILSPADEDATTHSSRLALETCASCHNDPVLAAKFGLDIDVVGSYVDSYHGWATRRGGRAASCVSCHTAHAILPPEDAASTVHAARIAATCRECHPGANARFAASYDHRAASIARNPLNRFLAAAYRLLITGVIGAMAVHNLVIVNYYLTARRRRNRARPGLLRLDRWQILQHLATAGAFFGLAVTGFALRFPDASWVRGLAAAGLDEALRGGLHRAFSLVLAAATAGHVLYIAANRRGRREFAAMLPRRQDVADLVENLRFHTWRRSRPPGFGRYDYTQKAEYWALVWGTGLMALTGLVLWLPELVVRLLPAWIVPASQIVHYYEAWLAVLAILGWHFFFVLFHPSVYPMSWTWLTGRMPEAEARRHHREWYEEEKARRHRGVAAAREPRAPGAVPPAPPAPGREPEA